LNTQATPLPCGCVISQGTSTRRFAGTISRCKTCAELAGEVEWLLNIHGDPGHCEVRQAQEALNRHLGLEAA
jgi:hypothetical protein